MEIEESNSSLETMTEKNFRRTIRLEKETSEKQQAQQKC